VLGNSEEMLVVEHNSFRRVSDFGRQMHPSSDSGSTAFHTNGNYLPDSCKAAPRELVLSQEMS
jgi:hypothetical protein